MAKFYILVFIISAIIVVYIMIKRSQENQNNKEE
jgi:preprotein translocase subunit YajC